MVRFFTSIYKYCRSVVQQFIDDDCLTSAASLSYTALLSIVPLMTVSLSIVSKFPVYDKYGAALEKLILDNFVATKADVIHQYLEQFTAQASQLPLTGLFFLIVTAILMVFNMESAMNVIWRVKQRRHGVAAFLIYWAVLTLLPILTLVGFAASRYVLNYLGVIPTAEHISQSLHLLEFTPYLITWVAFTFLYVTLPNTKVFIRHAILGGFMAMLLFHLAKYGFGLYIREFPTYELLYGTLATIPLFLVWIYVSWLIILLGAEMSSVLASGVKSS